MKNLSSGLGSCGRLTSVFNLMNVPIKELHGMNLFFRFANQLKGSIQIGLPCFLKYLVLI